MKTKHPERAPHRVECDLGRLLQARDMTLVQLAEVTGITVANLGVLKNGRARAIRYSTLTAICDALQCQPADLLTVRGEALTPNGTSPRNEPDFLRK